MINKHMQVEVKNISEKINAMLFIVLIEKLKKENTVFIFV